MNDFSFRANGKLLLTSEYFVMDGAKAIALPTKLGQTIKIRDSNTHSSKHPSEIKWEASTRDNKNWISASFSLENLKILKSKAQSPHILKKILYQARQIKPNFLEKSNNIHVETFLEFPSNWGLGSSSTLIYLIAKWAEICPFTLLQNTLGGSGYDIACSMAEEPINYQKTKQGRTWEYNNFMPIFKDNLYFVHLNKKQNSQQAIKQYTSIKKSKENAVLDLNNISEKILRAKTLTNFETLLHQHEKIISNHLQLPRIQETIFNDYWGVIKSLGAWGGDFVLATSNKSKEDSFAYFHKRGYKTVLCYEDLIL